MKCTRVEKFLPLYVAGDLAGRRGRTVENHLATCEECRLSADEYRASRDMFSAATLSPDFEGAFYDEIRNSVLAQIRHDHTLAPPFAFYRFFNTRLAYAASLSLLLIAAALTLHSYVRRTSEDGERAPVIANVERERPTPPTALKTPQAAWPESDERRTARPFKESARVATSKARRATKSSLPGVRTGIENARNKAKAVLPFAPHTPPAVGRNPHALTVAAAGRAKAEEINAGSGNNGETNAPPEVSRIEIQTSDPNIRIIWLSRGVEDSAQPLN